MGFEKLSAEDHDEALAFLESAPEYNVVLTHNIGRFGMDEGEFPLNGRYFGRREASGLAAVGAVYNLGPLFFFARDSEAVKGMAAYLAETRLRPWFTQGPRPQVELLLSELAGLGEPEPKTLLSEWQVLRSRVASGIDTTGTRPARVEELGTLVEMGQAMHRELFDMDGMEDASLRELLALQIELGGAFVREVEGEIVSKAEATPARPHAALVGGVYTLPSRRGEGHSTSCVAALCRHLLGEVGAVTLSVERGNEAACQAYRRIGFQKVADWMVVSFAGRQDLPEKDEE